MRCWVAAPWRCRCGMLPIHVTNIIIICNIVSILTIYFAKNFTVHLFKTHPHTMPTHRWGLPWHETNKKAGSAEKKSCLPLTVGYRVYQGCYILTGWILCHNRPSEAHRFGCSSLQAALQATPFACMELSTICHLRWHFRPRFASSDPYLWAGIVCGCVLNE